MFLRFIFKIGRSQLYKYEYSDIYDENLERER